MITWAVDDYSVLQYSEYSVIRSTYSFQSNVDRRQQADCKALDMAVLVCFLFPRDTQSHRTKIPAELSQQLHNGIEYSTVSTCCLITYTLCLVSYTNDCFNKFINLKHEKANNNSSVPLDISNIRRCQLQAHHVKEHGPFPWNFAAQTKPQRLLFSDHCIIHIAWRINHEFGKR